MRAIIWKTGTGLYPFWFPYGLHSSNELSPLNRVLETKFLVIQCRRLLENAHLVFIFTVNSTTLPVVLRCSSRVDRFTFKIDEIKLSLRNQTNIFLSPSTSTAVQQCDQAQHQEQRQECQFDINYGSLGIDSFMVYSVAVKYHCLD